MAYMKDSTGRRLDSFQVQDRQGALARSLVRPMLSLPPVMGTPPTRTLNPALGSHTSYTLAQSLAKVTVKGGLFSTYTANGYDSWRNTISPINGTLTQPAPSIVAFHYDGATPDIKYRDTGGSNTSEFHIFVNEFDGLGEQRATAFSEPTGASALGGGAQVIRLTFATAKHRRIRVLMKNCEFAGVRGLPTDTFTPAPAEEPTIGLLLDSWGASRATPAGYTTPPVASTNTLWFMGALLAGLEPMLCAQSGTGLITPTTNPDLGVFADTRRINPLVTAGPDYILVTPSLNDYVNSTPNPSAVAAALTSLCATFATSLPNTKIIVAGPQSIGTAVGLKGDADADAIATRNAVKTAALAAPNVISYIDPIAEGWITGGGDQKTPTGGGNSDKFRAGYHLTQDGDAALSQTRVLQALVQALRA